MTPVSAYQQLDQPATGPSRKIGTPSRQSEGSVGDSAAPVVFAEHERRCHKQAALCEFFASSFAQSVKLPRISSSSKPMPSCCDRLRSLKNLVNASVPSVAVPSDRAKRHGQ
jgi:hypothetical protein